MRGELLNYENSKTNKTINKSILRIKYYNIYCYKIRKIN